MAASLPVVATHVGGVPEVVQDGVTGLLVAPDEPQVLAAGMLTMSAAPERALAMGQAGRARYLAHFTDQAMVQATLALYARLGPR